MEKNTKFKLSRIENELFEAIEKKETNTVRDIINEEESKLVEGLSPTIRPNAQNENGDTFCHYAARTGVKDIISKILLSSIYFTHDLQNNKGNLPINLDWNDQFKNQLPYREEKDKKREENRLLFEAYQKHVNKITEIEKEKGGYKKGIIFTNDFTLFYSSKKSEQKDYFIKDQSSFGNYSIHDRQAIDEAVKSNQRTLKESKEWLESPPNLTSQNYLLVNIGFVMNIENYTKGKIIKRDFFSIPLYLSEKIGTDVELIKKRNTTGHTEANLYNLLLDSNSLSKILAYFRRVFKIPEQEKRKLYVCVIDMHSSQDMCDSCEKETYEFETLFIETLKNVTVNNYFQISKHFRTVVRISSSRPPSHSDYRKPAHRRQLEPKYYLDFTARENVHQNPLDLKKSEIFILHYNADTQQNRGAVFYKKEKLSQTKIHNILPRTLFFVGQNSKPWHNPKFPKDYDNPTDITRDLNLG